MANMVLSFVSCLTVNYHRDRSQKPKRYITVTDPDLQIREGGYPDTEIRGRGGGWVFQFGLKSKGVPGPPGPSPGSATT